MSRAVLVERLWDYAGQAVLLALVLWLAWSGLVNFLGNVRVLGLAAGYGFLDAEAGFQIAQSLIAFSPRSSYLDVVIVAALNSLLVIVLASVLSTLIGLVMAFGRLASHGLIRGAAATYVEVFRNIPLLLQILFWYFSAIAVLPGVGDSLAFGGALLNNRGLFLPRVQVTMAGGSTLVAGLAAFVGLFWLARRWLKTTARDNGWSLALSGAIIALLCLAPLALMRADFGIDNPQVEGFNVGGGFAVLPELAALTLGLSIYNSTFLAEIFRAGILSVPRGQAEAAATVGLSGVRAALLITLPQAMRVAL
jgi:general L-amino acid transport system permease protein